MDYSFYAYGGTPGPELPIHFTGLFTRRKKNKKNDNTSSISSPSMSSFATTSDFASGHGSKPPTPKKPMLYNAEYFQFLSEGVEGIKKDYQSGAREMAGYAIHELGTLIELAAITARDRQELWDMARHAVRELGSARPSMSAAMMSALLRALADIERVWNEMHDGGVQMKKEDEVEHLVTIAMFRVQRILNERGKAGGRLGEVFRRFVEGIVEDADSEVCCLTSISLHCR